MISSQKNASTKISAFKYIASLALTVFVCIVLIIVTNGIADPKGYFYWVEIPGINNTKYYANGGRIEKASRLSTGKYNAVIGGTSRAQVGINPLDDSLKSYTVYNSGLSATNMLEIERVLAYAKSENDIKLLILGLDFIAFSTRRRLGFQFGKSLFSSKLNYIHLLDYLISGKELVNSYKTITGNLEGMRAIFSDKNGFLDKTKATVDHRKLFTTILTKNFLVKAQTYGDFQYGKDRLRSLENILSDYMKSGTTVYLYISPVHARQLEALHVLGLFDEFESWKRDLVKVIQRVELLAGKKIPLWDFSGYNSITSENVPRYYEKTKKMKWYWESSHFKKEAGSLVLQKMTGKGPFNHVPEDFGHRLTAENVDAHLVRIRQEREAYKKIKPNEVLNVEKLAELTQNIRLNNKIGTINTHPPH